ncbi:hypothetical protein [Daejeonella sp.]|uniref:hypothetical protein n=1 Tax=Daejeonella sp. TaxID=2805397 RepID=UPI00272FACA5|nr:hypothetical protein [Daejeonella sp.]MDP2415092.1 hypothetical protein [Daejeonella sp.]
MKAVLKIFLLIIAYMVIRPVMAQQNSVQGLIMERSGASRIAGVYILNKKTGISTFSNELGLFRIAASVGDTLNISKSGYSDLILPLLELSDKVLMLQGVISLSEVKVLGQSKKQELDEVRDQYRKNGSYYAGKPPLLAYFFRPLTALYELIGKTPAQARRFNAYYLKELQESEVDRRFSAYAITNVTGLEGNDLKNFMILYRPDYQNVAKFDEYAMINYIKKSLQLFNDAGRPKAIRSLPPLPKAPDLSEKNLKY